MTEILMKHLINEHEQKKTEAFCDKIKEMSFEKDDKLFIEYLIKKLQYENKEKFSYEKYNFIYELFKNMISENTTHIQNMRKEYMKVVKMMLAFEKQSNILDNYNKEYKLGIFQMIFEFIRRTNTIPPIDVIEIMVRQAIKDL